MSEFALLKKAAGAYARRYGVKLKFGKPYDLKIDWKETWPDNAKSGCYGVFDKNKSLLYVGKADHFGKRLGKHFRYDKRKQQGVARESGWTRQPRYVLTMVVIHKWEAPSLEAYLITSMEKHLVKQGRSLDNVRGKK